MPSRQITPVMTDNEFLNYTRSGGDIRRYQRVNEQGDGALLVASRIGRLDIVEALIDANASVNETSDGNSSPLTAASMRGHIDIVRRLLSSGADPNRETDSKDTPLSLAVWKNHTKVVKALIRARADCSHVDKYGDTVLIDAIKHGNFEIIKYVLSSKAPINHTNNHGNSALILACKLGKTECGLLLMDRGADVNVPDEKGNSAFYNAAKMDNVVICKHMVEEAKVCPLVREKNGTWAGGVAGAACGRAIFSKCSPQDLLTPEEFNNLIAPPLRDEKFMSMIKDGHEINSSRWVFGAKKDRPLIRACRVGKLSWVKEIVNAKADPNDVNTENVSALVEASMRGFTSIVKYLLSKKAIVNIVTKKEDTPLSLAVWKNHEDTARLLIEAKADCSHQDSFGDNILIDATKNGNLSLCRTLLKSYKDDPVLIKSINHQNKDGNSAFMLACQQRKIECGRLLLEQKADPKLVNRSGVSALFLGASNGAKELCRLLIEESNVDPKARENNGTWAGDFALGVCRSFFPGARKALTREEMDKLIAPPIRDEDFITMVKGGQEIKSDRWFFGGDKKERPLIRACRKGNLEWVETLVKARANPNDVNSEDATPLVAASKRGYTAIVEYLLFQGAVVNVITRTKDTPLSLSVWKNHTDTAMLLIRAKGDCSRVDRYGDNVLIDATRHGNIRLCETILSDGDFASINHQNKDGYSAFMVACHQKKTGCGRLLYERKADPTLLNKHGVSALYLAAQSGAVDLCRLLIEEAKIDPKKREMNGSWAGDVARDDECRSYFPGAKRPLTKEERTQLIAPPIRDEDFIAMIKKGQEIQSDRWRFGENRERPLIRACRKGNLEWVKEIVKAKGDPHELNNKGATPIVAAAMRGYTLIVAYLLSLGVDINRMTKNGDSPLSLACWKNHSDTAIFLIDKKADVTRVDNFGDTVLLDAAKNGASALCQRLLDTNKFKLNHRNREKKSALINAVENKHADTVDVLLKAKANPDGDVLLAMVNDGDEDSKDKSSSYFSPLMIASQNGSEHIIKSLLSARANPDYTTPDGKDMLAIAHPSVQQIFLNLRLKRQSSIQVDTSRNWSSLTSMKEAIDYICQEFKSENMSAVIIRQLNHHCCAEYVGDLFTTAPLTWDTLSVPKRFKAMLQEIVRLARKRANTTKPSSSSSSAAAESKGKGDLMKEEYVREQIRSLQFKSRMAERKTKLEMYKSIIEIAISDEVLTSKELGQIQTVRVKHSLTDQDHDLILQQIGISKEQYQQYTRNKLKYPRNGGYGDDGMYHATNNVEESKAAAAKLLTCVVCLDARSDHVVVPCMHLCLCGDCAPFYKQQQGNLACPKCRSKVETAMKVFL